MVGVRAFLLLVFAWLFRRLSRFLGRLRIGDGKLDSTPRGRILKNMVIGMIAVLGVHFMSELPMIRKNSESAMDWMIRMNAGTNPARASQARPFVFLDIDELTYRQWGEPLFVPRDKLLRLIRAAVEGKAAAVLVDVELSRAMGPGDEELEHYLATLGAETRTNVVLARGLRRASEEGLLEERPSFLNSMVAQSSAIHWGSTAYALDDDGAVRRWRLWELACGSNGEQAVPVPSVQLQVLAALDPDPDRARWRARNALAGLEQKTCRRNEVLAPDARLTLANVRVSVRDEELGRRILYSLPWKLKEGEARQTISWRGQDDHPLLTVRPAYTLTEGQPNTAAGQWEEQIVVIGASFAESRDTFMTPLGEMPGAVVIINTLQSLLQHGETQAPPFWLMLLFEVLVILILSVLFAYFSSFWGVIVTGAVVIFGMVPASFFLFRDGIWLNFALPVVVVQLMQLGDEFKSLRKNIPPARQ